MRVVGSIQNIMLWLKCTYWDQNYSNVLAVNEMEEYNQCNQLLEAQVAKKKP